MCSRPYLCTGLLQEVAEEAAGGFFVHSSSCSIVVVLSLADVSDFWIASFWVHEDQSADACVWSHCITVCQLDSEALSLTVVMTVAIAAAGAALVMSMLVVSVSVTAVLVAVSWLVWVIQIGAFAEKSEDVLLEGVVWAA